MSLAVRINLLDWRAAERAHKRRQFISLLIAVALLTLLIIGILPVLYYQHLISRQNARNHYLQTQIAVADKKLAEIRKLKKTRAKLMNRMQVIGDLQQSRSASVHYLDQITATIPDGVVLTGLDQSRPTTTLAGVAQSNARVSQYMTNLDDSAWFTHSRLVVIKRDGHGHADFTLKVDSDKLDQGAAARTFASGDSNATGSKP